MEERSSQLVVVVGASDLANEVRRHALRQSIPVAGVTVHLRGLRQLLVRGEFDHVSVFISFDPATIARHSVNLNSLINDRFGFASVVSVVGLVPDGACSLPAAKSGCDFYANTALQALWGIRRIACQRAPAGASGVNASPNGDLCPNRMPREPLAEDFEIVLDAITQGRSCSSPAHQHGV